jgi:hypothetical protein
MPAVPPFEQLVRSVDQRAASGMPVERLRAAAETSQELSAEADRLLDHYVRIARESGASWTEIGAVLGVSKQAAQQRFPQPSNESQTQAAYAALVTAEAEALALSHNYVGTEHVLLALSRDADSVAGHTLRDHAVTPDAIKRHIEEIIGASATAVDPPLPWTPRARRVAKSAGKQARRTRCRRVQTGHLLLAMLELTDSVAAQILLERHQLAPAEIHADVLRRIPRGET